MRMEDTFALYDLKVEVLASEKPMVCGHHAGDYFLVEGENLVFPQTRSFSLYALAALLPLLPAKQRVLDANDWMLSDSIIACPDPNCGARFRITRLGRRTLHHSACTVVPLTGQAAEAGDENAAGLESPAGESAAEESAAERKSAPRGGEREGQYHGTEI